MMFIDCVGTMTIQQVYLSVCLSVSLSAICLFVIHALWLNCTFAGKLFEHVNRIARQQPYGTKSDFLQLLICLK